MHAHCYLHRPHLVPFGHRFPVAPQYLLKLKSAAAIALVSATSISRSAQRVTLMFDACAHSLLTVQYVVQARNAQPPEAVRDETVTAQALNAETHEAALHMLAEPERALYSQRGKQLTFLPDRHAAVATFVGGCTLASPCRLLLQQHGFMVLLHVHVAGMSVGRSQRQ